jgi:hypothetical protein
MGNSITFATLAFHFAKLAEWQARCLEGRYPFG